MSQIATIQSVTHVLYAARFDHFGGELESRETNVQMLENLLNALEPVSERLQHIHLVHGTKYYGHTVKERPTPYLESDPCGNFNSFYFEQQRMLEQRQSGQDWSWSISRPHAFCNYRIDEPRNMILIVGLYASILRELGLPLIYPGTPRSFVAKTQFSWLPLIAGLSLANAVSSFSGSVRAMVKWPNDVLISDQKIAGVLSEALADLSGVVIGTGLNVFQNREELPVDTASSLLISGVKVPSIDAVLAEYLKNLRKNYDEFVALKGELAGTELLKAIKNACATIGLQVRAIMPGEKELVGEAIDIDDLGRIVINHDGKHTPVSVGDIVHLRHN